MGAITTTRKYTYLFDTLNELACVCTCTRDPCIFYATNKLHLSLPSTCIATNIRSKCVLLSYHSKYITHAAGVLDVFAQNLNIQAPVVRFKPYRRAYSFHFPHHKCSLQRKRRPILYLRATLLRRSHPRCYTTGTS